MSQYALMHKNDVCGSLVIDDETGSLRVYKDNGSGLSPFLGNADTRRMKLVGGKGSSGVKKNDAGSIETSRMCKHKDVSGKEFSTFYDRLILDTSVGFRFKV